MSEPKDDEYSFNEWMNNEELNVPHIWDATVQLIKYYISKLYYCHFDSYDVFISNKHMLKLIFTVLF